ncbi:zinc finger protein 26-like [Achroia grisella]|uniref:zinc finger protein 26-like n=1 Tax=Achroia grisella TaxID=688607 RepID=UPI0027D2C6CA|nr:zinc finger protein 26-like [Achroia grisella]
MEYSPDIVIKEEQEMYSDNSLDLKFEILTDVKIEEIQVYNNVEDAADSGRVVSYRELTDTGDQMCLRCYRVLPNRYSLLKHNLSHLHIDVEYCPTQKYRCNYCSALYYSESEQKHHFCIEKQENLLQIRNNIKKEKTQNHIKQENKQICNGDPPNGILYTPTCGIPKTKALHKCNTCDRIFTYKRWHDHITNTHTNDTESIDGKVKCNICNKLFKKLYIKKHIQHIHEGKKPSWRSHKIKEVDAEYSCTLCNSKLHNSTAYKTHLRNCHNTDIVECNICKSKLKKSNMFHHMRRKHCTDGVVHRCEYCKKVYQALYYLKIHLKHCRKRI